MITWVKSRYPRPRKADSVVGVLAVFALSIVFVSSTLADPTLSFVTDRSGDEELQMIGATPVEHLNISRRSDSDERSHSWSPDGWSVAIASSRLERASDIYVTTALGADSRNLTKTAAISETQPSWSPNGREIAIKSAMAGKTDIWIMTRSGRKRRNLTKTLKINEAFPSWSPDSKRLVFRARRDDKQDLYSIKRDGSGLKRLTATTGINETMPDWSPDGSQIAFVSDEYGQQDIFTLQVETGQVQRITFTDDRDESSSSWSPDGNSLAFEVNNGRNLEIFVSKPDGSSAVNATRALSNEFAPQWRPSVKPDEQPPTVRRARTKRLSQGGRVIAVRARDKRGGSGLSKALLAVVRKAGGVCTALTDSGLKRTSCKNPAMLRPDISKTGKRGGIYTFEISRQDYSRIKNKRFRVRVHTWDKAGNVGRGNYVNL